MWPDVDATDTGADVNSLLTLKQHTYVTIRQAPEVKELRHLGSVCCV